MQRQKAINILRTITMIGIYGGLLMPVMFIPMVIFPFVFSKLVFFQVLIGLTFPAYLALAWAEPQYRPRKSYVYWSLLAYFAAIGISTVFSADPARSWWGNQERMNGLFTLLHLLAWLTMTVSLIKTWEQWRYLLNWQVVLGVFMACVALLQKPFPNLLGFPAGGRIGGLLDNPIYMGGYQIFIMFFVALLFVKTKSFNWRLWYLFAAITTVSAFFGAGSRGPFMGMLFGMVLAAITVGVLSKNKKIRYSVIGAVLATGLFYVGMVTAGVKTQAFQDFSVQFPTAARMFMLEHGTAGRFIAWDIAWEGFLERPLTGWGFDNFHVLFNTNYNPQSLRSGYYETWFDRAHNQVMDVLSMTGLFGFLTFAALWISLYITVIQARRKKYLDIPTTAVLVGLPAGYFLQNLFVFDHPAAFSMSYLLYALVICAGLPAFADKEAEQQETAKAKTVPWLTFGIVQAAAVLLVYLTSLTPFYASKLLLQGNKEFTVGNFGSALELFRKAASTPTPYLDDQTFLLARSLMTIADNNALDKVPQWKDMYQLFEDVHARHLAVHGVNAHPVYIYATTLDKIGRAANDAAIIAKAEEQYKRTIELSPKRQQLYFSYAQLLVQNGRVEEALQQYLTAASFDEEIGEGWWYVGMVYGTVQNETDKAAEYIQKAVTVTYPYQAKTVQDAYFMALAYKQLNNTERMRELVYLLPQLPPGQPERYIQIASLAEQIGLTAERDLIVNAVTKMDAKSQQYLKPFLTGEVDTIEEALAITIVDQQAVEQNNPIKTNSETKVATATEPKAEDPVYSGPRR